jgi:hypothetical protein
MGHSGCQIYQYKIDQRNRFIPYQWFVVIKAEKPVKEEKYGRND